MEFFAVKINFFCTGLAGILFTTKNSSVWPSYIIVLAVSIPVEFVVASVDVKAAVKNPWFSVGNIFVALKVNKKNPSQYFYREGLA